VVLQLHNYKVAPNPLETPPGFSRWYFNFSAISEGVPTEPNRRSFARAVKLKYHRLKPGGVLVLVLPTHSCEIEGPPAKAWWCPDHACSKVIAAKLKYHRLKPGGVLVLVLPTHSCEIKVPPAKAWWCRSTIFQNHIWHPTPHVAASSLRSTHQLNNAAISLSPLFTMN